MELLVIRKRKITSVRQAVFFMPLFLFLVGISVPYSSVRLSLIWHGHPFARVVPKNAVNIFPYVDRDSFACSALVFEGSSSIGWIDSPTNGGIAWYVPWSSTRFLDDYGSPRVLETCFEVLWMERWFLLLVQAVVFLLAVNRIHTRRQLGGSKDARQNTGTVPPA